MTSDRPSTPKSQPQQMPLAPLLHRGKPRYFLEDLQRGLHSLLLLCSRLVSSPHNESFKSTLISFHESLLSISKQLDDHQTSLTKSSLSSPGDEDRPAPQT